jgi:hypothetical protein
VAASDTILPKASMDLIQIDTGYQSWRMKADPTSVFLAKKTAGGLWYYIILSNGHRLRHTADVVERLAEPIPVEAK